MTAAVAPAATDLLIELSEAWTLIGDELRPGPATRRPVQEAHGLVLAAPVQAAIDSPPFDKSVMDGYAVRAADARPGAILTATDLVRAGQTPPGPVHPGTATRINTGAPIPPGADAVVPVERARPRADGTHIEILMEARPGQHMTRRAADLRAGDIVLDAGTRLSAVAWAAAVAAGAAEVIVHERPRVAVVVTGDELLPAGAAPSPGMIYDSNRPLLTGLVAESGAITAMSGVVPDDPVALDAALLTALREPVVVVVGGMSKGTHDLVPGRLEALGVRWRFRGVNMRPGKPVAYGRGPSGQHVFGLPGNPVSCCVCFLLFVKPVLDGLQGRPPRWGVTRFARLRQDLPARRDSRPAFLPGLLSDESQGATVAAVQWHGSGDPFGPARGNVLIHQPRGDEAVSAGTVVGCLPLAG